MESKKHQRAGTNAVSSRVSAMKNSQIPVDLPEGVELRSEEEMTIWRQFTRARARSDWRDLDLLLLAKIVRNEADIRKYQLMLDTSGPLIKNKRETLIENPLLRVIDTLQRQQLAIIRTMSLNATGSDARTLAASADQEVEARALSSKDNVYSLLAVPTR